MIARLDPETDEWLTLAKPHTSCQNGMVEASYMFTISPDTKIPKLKINSIICIVKP